MGFELVSIGMINALGAQLPDIESALFFNQANSLVRDTTLLFDNEPCIVGKVSDDLPELPQRLDHLDSRFSRVLFALYQQIESSVQDAVRIFGANRVGIVIGSSTGGVDKSEPAFVQRNATGSFPEWYRFFNQEVGSGSSMLAAVAGVRGPAYTVSTACSSSAKVFKSAQNLLRYDICDAVIVGGVDSLCQLTVRGFRCLNLLSSDLANPLSRNRKGLNIGEGGALFLMVKGEHGVQLRGVGESSDAYHISTPHPEGRGALAAMQQALNEAGALPTQVRYINMHGTATQFNDAMESKAIYQLCLEQCLAPSPATWSSSTKPFTGHLLGASGATEVGFCMLSLMASGSKKLLPPHCWDAERDAELPELAVATFSQSVAFGRDDLMLSNSFAFGGSNCCVALGLGETLA